jgi:hypothetical protein
VIHRAEPLHEAPLHGIVANALPAPHSSSRASEPPEAVAPTAMLLPVHTPVPGVLMLTVVPPDVPPEDVPPDGVPLGGVPTGGVPLGVPPDGVPLGGVPTGGVLTPAVLPPAPETTGGEVASLLIVTGADTVRAPDVLTATAFT